MCKRQLLSGNPGEGGGQITRQQSKDAGGKQHSPPPSFYVRIRLQSSRRPAEKVENQSAKQVERTRGAAVVTSGSLTRLCHTPPSGRSRPLCPSE